MKSPRWLLALCVLSLSIASQAAAPERVRVTTNLGSFVIEGVPTTIPFLSQVARDEHFVRGDVDTGFIERFMSERGGG